MQGGIIRVITLPVYVVHHVRSHARATVPYSKHSSSEFTNQHDVSLNRATKCNQEDVSGT